MYAEITSTIACNSVSFFVVVLFFFLGGWRGGGEGDVSVCLGFARLRVNQV